MRRVLPVLSAAVLAAVLAACATPAPPPPPPRPAPPPPPPPTPMEEFAWSERPGTNSLLGVIAYRPAGTAVWSCNGQSVALTPETSYSRGRMITLYGSADRALLPVTQVQARSQANQSMDYSRFVSSTSCDAQDSFAFRNLPDGAYFIIARVRQIRPVVAAGPAGSNDMVVMQRVELTGGAAVRIVLPQSVPAARPAPAPAARPAPARPAPRR